MLRTLSFLRLLCCSITGAAATPTPPELWATYDPQTGDFREEIVREETKNGIY